MAEGTHSFSQVPNWQPGRLSRNPADSTAPVAQEAAQPGDSRSGGDGGATNRKMHPPRILFPIPSLHRCSLDWGEAWRVGARHHVEMARITLNPLDVGTPNPLSEISLLGWGQRGAWLPGRKTSWGSNQPTRKGLDMLTLGVDGETAICRHPSREVLPRYQNLQP